MNKSVLNIVHCFSLRDYASMHSGEMIDFQGNQVRMPAGLDVYDSPALKGKINLLSAVYDDDSANKRDTSMIGTYNIEALYPKVSFQSIASSYRAMSDPHKKQAHKQIFERSLQDFFYASNADIIVLDALLVILKDCVGEKSPWTGKIYNIHPGITDLSQPFVRRGLYATRDTWLGGQGKEQTPDGVVALPSPVLEMGASFHCVNQNIDDGPTVCDSKSVLDPTWNIDEMRYMNFKTNVVPALESGLLKLWEQLNDDA